MSAVNHHIPQQDAATARITTPAGVTLSYDMFGRGAPIVLVHGSFTDHRTNWQFVADQLVRHFTVYAVARRGRGETDATEGHGVLDEAADVAALIRAIGEPVVLLGHSYGAQVALAAARQVATRVEKLILYEPPVTEILTDATARRLEELARTGDWDGFTATFMQEVIAIPAGEFAEMRNSPLWPQMVADAPCVLHEIRALQSYAFDVSRFADLAFPVIMQIGTESPPALYATEALMAVLPDVRLQKLPEQGHDAMFTNPDLYAGQVLKLLKA